MDQYRTSGVLDEAAYREISRVSLSPRYVWFIRIYAVVLALLGILMLIARKYHYTALFAVLTVLFALTPGFISRRRLSVTIKPERGGAQIYPHRILLHRGRRHPAKPDQRRTGPFVLWGHPAGRGDTALFLPAYKGQPVCSGL